MSVPSSAVRRSAKTYLAYHNQAWTPRVIDANAAESTSLPEPQRFPPICRLDAPTRPCGPVNLMWLGEARTFEATNSFQQKVGAQEAGAVASYAWSVTGGGETITGGTASATLTLAFSTAGHKEIACEVTDGNGVTTTGQRHVHVVTRPGNGADDAITDVRVESFSAHLPERGWGGTAVTVSFPGGAQANTFQPGMPVCLYVERYEDGSLASAGEVFSGFVIGSRLEIDPYGDRIQLTLGTIEALLNRPGADGADHTFIDREAISEAIGTADPMTGFTTPGNLAFLEQAPLHEFSHLTPVKGVYHLLRYHLLVDIGASTDALTDRLDFITDWWNTDSLRFKVWLYSVPRGPIRRAVESLIPQNHYKLYSTRLSGIVCTESHFAKSTPDAVVATVDENLVYPPIRPYLGAASPVGQVKIVNTPSLLRDLETEENLEVVYPDPATSGSQLVPSDPYWFTNQLAGQELAKALYDDANSTDQVEVELAGMTYDLHNTFDFTLTGYSLYPWTARVFQVERVTAQVDHETSGDWRQRVLGREVSIS